MRHNAFTVKKDFFYYDDAELLADNSYEDPDTRPHILWSQGDLRLTTGSTSEFSSSAGRLEVVKIKYGFGPYILILLYRVKFRIQKPDYTNSS